MNEIRRIAAVLAFAARGLIRRPLQTALLLVVLTVSLAGTMTIMAVLSGVKQQMFQDLKRVGLDVVNVQMVPDMENLLLSPLLMEDARWMLAGAPGSRLAPFRVDMATGADLETERSADFLLLSTTHEWGVIAPQELIAGRFLKPGETDACVLDEQIARRLHPSGNAIGRDLFVTIDGAITVFRIVGVLKDPFAIRQRFDELDFAGAARSTINRILEFKSVYIAHDFSEPHEPIHGAVVQVASGQDAKAAARAIQGAIDERGLPIVAWARKDWVNNVMKGADLTTQVAGMIWIIVLFVTGVMILTISLVAIRERYRELAIRRTEGALRVQIVSQLLLENVLLSALGGGMAVILARQTGHLLESRYLSWPPVFLPNEMALALVLGIGIGALATVIPAWRAASLDPVEVLRRT
ncbi:MAG: ABC transporter permease [Verrucomicrobiae bacterium]|nr:ABC transporter permease [Verrucomicrobiae bacterium]